jgi:hypothetical protein
VENRGSNVPLSGLVGRLRIVEPGSTAPVLFETEAPLPLLLPGTAWDGRYTWPSAGPSGTWSTVFEVRSAAGAALSSSSAALVVQPGATTVSGTLGIAADVLAGSAIDALVSVTDHGTTPLMGYPVVVQVAAGATVQVLAEASLAFDLAPGETRTSTVRISTSGIGPGAYPMFLREAVSGRILDRTRVRIHGAITAPSIDSPVDGATVATSHPVLRVNDAATPEGAALTYEFQVFADVALTQAVAGVTGMAETPVHTSWRVDANLGEDRTFYWRARATDGFSPSAWTPVAALTVDAVNLPPAAPVPDAPGPGATVASRQPLLVVANAFDPEQASLVYEFQVATDPGLTAVLASAADVAEGPGLTSWRIPIVLDEDATYSWRARASDGSNVSGWSLPIAFTVHTLNRTPTAPVPRTPVGGEAVATLTPTLVVTNARDPEADVLTYRFEIDRVPSFDSPALQVSPEVPEGPGETSWTPLPLADDTAHYWRASASDGHTTSAFAGATFFVNLANDPPGVPVPLDPVDGRTVRTATPELRARNTTDRDSDALRYEFEVRDASGAVIASSPGVSEGLFETTWVVGVALPENGRFTWRVRASDGQAAGEWSAPAAFRVDAVAEPPTAPAPVSPVEAARLETRRPTLVVANASSPDGLALTYAFEVYRVAGDGTLRLVDQVAGIPEGVGTTSWTVSVDLDDGSYAWRARASDPAQTGPWMPSAHFTVSIDVPPAPPAGLAAVPGYASVALSWRASTEPDVVGYRVYRAPSATGPFLRVGSPVVASFEDRGLVNGVTVYYQVTAVDARFESARSATVAATPVAPPPSVVVAEVRFDPAAVDGECLLGSGPDAHHGDDHDDDGGCRSSSCPESLYVTVELPPGLDPSTIDLGTVRLAGSVPAAAGYFHLTDVDHDAVREAQFRFRWTKVVPVLRGGSNDLTVIGSTPSVEFRGTGRLDVRAIQADLHVSPQTLSRHSHGSDVEAQMTLCCDLDATEISAASLRLNGRLSPTRIVSSSRHKLVAKFDRAAVIAILPTGEHVEVRVTGTVRGVPFESKDTIRVTQ